MDKIFFVFVFLGYDIGCVSSERYEKFKSMENDLSKTKEILKNVNKPLKEWRKILNLDDSKSPYSKRYIF